MQEVKILQCGHDKSGTYLLFKVLSHILRCNNRYRSFVASSGIGYVIDQLCAQYKRYPEINEVDLIRKVDNVWGLNFPSPDCRHVPVDLDLVLDVSSLIYTHEKPMDVTELLSRFTHRIYILRDGRDVVNSMIHFLTNEISLKLCPSYTINSPEALYADLSYFEGLVSRWHKHVVSYKTHQDRFFLVKFEELISNREYVIAALSEHLGLLVDAKELAQDTSFGAMRKSAPQHLREGKVGNWRLHFTDEHKQIFKRVAGEVLVQLGYEATNDW